jgi:protein-disulfide isomerase
LLEKYPLQVKLLHKFIPAHDFTMKATVAALAAEEQGKFWEFHDKLFEFQSVLNQAKVMEIASSMHLDLKRFQEKMKDPALMEMVEGDYAEAKKLGVLSTPWVYINGWHATDRSLQSLSEVIDRELQKNQ